MLGGARRLQVSRVSVFAAAAQPVWQLQRLPRSEQRCREQRADSAVELEQWLLSRAITVPEGKGTRHGRRIFRRRLPMWVWNELDSEAVALPAEVTWRALATTPMMSAESNYQYARTPRRPMCETCTPRNLIQ